MNIGNNFSFSSFDISSVSHPSSVSCFSFHFFAMLMLFCMEIWKMKNMDFEYLSFFVKDFFNVQVRGMITDFGDDMHCQFLEILRILLDSCTLSGAQVQLSVIFSDLSVLPCLVADIYYLAKMLLNLD